MISLSKHFRDPRLPVKIQKKLQFFLHGCIGKEMFSVSAFKSLIQRELHIKISISLQFATFMAN